MSSGRSTVTWESMTRVVVPALFFLTISALAVLAWGSLWRAIREATTLQDAILARWGSAALHGRFDFSWMTAIPILALVTIVVAGWAAWCLRRHWMTWSMWGATAVFILASTCLTITVAIRDTIVTCNGRGEMCPMGLGGAEMDANRAALLFLFVAVMALGLLFFCSVYKSLSHPPLVGAIGGPEHPLTFDDELHQV